ncbi:MAG: NUDIX hydrolase [Lachnospiraceae bacterium]|nr:NUDIX hydrolase [Lachnospiraceae bacterium]
MNAIKRDGSPFDYYFASRIALPEHIHALTGEYRAEGISIYAVKEDDPGQILMVKQYRYPVGREVYELPAGLVDGDESASEAAIREIREETGLTLSVVYDSSANRSGSQSLVPGFSDETCAFVYGTVSGNITSEYLEDTERITAFFADKIEVGHILKEEFVAARPFASLLLFLQSDETRPFAFLDAIR